MRQPLFLMLEDGAVFEGVAIGQTQECVGLLSFYTGVVGYQEVISDPANIGKIVLFTYPIIGSYGVNAADAESSGPTVHGVIVREYPPYYSNFRAEASLHDYLDGTGVAFGARFDTRAILLHLREHGEMMAVISAQRLSQAEVADRISGFSAHGYHPENRALECASPRIRAQVVDLGAGKSFYRQLEELGVACVDGNGSDIAIVTNCPFFSVEDQDALAQVRGLVGRRPVIGFGHGASLVAGACGARVERMKFGHHGVNVPVRCITGGRNEITVQNHIYGFRSGDGLEPLFENLHDGTCEGFVNRRVNAAGVNFVPGREWFDVVLNAVGVN